MCKWKGQTWLSTMVLFFAGTPALCPVVGQSWIRQALTVTFSSSCRKWTAESKVRERGEKTEEREVKSLEGFLVWSSYQSTL